MDIAIIGAGPVGCYAGHLLAKAGHKVSIYEEHDEIGSPIQCTGLLTADFDQFNLPKDDFLVNTFSRVEVFSPGQKLEVRQKEYLVCRNKFDNFFAGMARKSGAEIFLRHSFLRRESGSLMVKNHRSGQELKISPDIVLAADGPSSPTAKAYGFYSPERKYYFGLQARVKGSFNPEMFSSYFGSKVCPNFFAWIVPENESSARVGLAALKDSRKYFDQFIKEQGFKVVEMQGGVIPLYHPGQKLCQDNCYLLGDAAGFVKATTLGGLIPGLKQAEILADCINSHKNYQTEIKPLVRQLKLHLKVRAIFDRFSDADWDRLLSYAGSKKMQPVFEKYTRDNPLPLLAKSLLKEPKFLYFLKYLF